MIGPRYDLDKNELSFNRYIEHKLSLSIGNGS